MNRRAQSILALALACSTGCLSVTTNGGTNTALTNASIHTLASESTVVETPTATVPPSVLPNPDPARSFASSAQSRLGAATAQLAGRDGANTNLVTRLQTGEVRALLGAEPGPSTTPPPADQDGIPSSGWFVAGVIVASLGAAGTIAAGTTGHIHSRRVADGYADGMTHEELDDRVKRGERANIIAASSAAVGIAGVVLAATIFGVHYSRCGKLARKREHCRDQP